MPCALVLLLQLPGDVRVASIDWRDRRATDRQLCVSLRLRNPRRKFTVLPAAPSVRLLLLDDTVSQTVYRLYDVEVVIFRLISWSHVERETIIFYTYFFIQSTFSDTCQP